MAGTCSVLAKTGLGEGCPQLVGSWPLLAEPLLRRRGWGTGYHNPNPLSRDQSTFLTTTWYRHQPNTKVFSYNWSKDLGFLLYPTLTF